MYESRTVMTESQCTTQARPQGFEKGGSSVHNQPGIWGLLG